MATITDFKTWLDCNDLSDFNDVYSLYHSVQDVEKWAGFSTERGKKEGVYIVKSVECDDNLLLASENARSTFLSVIESRYCEGMDIETYYIYHHGIAKDD